MLPHPGLPPFEYVRATSPDQVVRLLLGIGDPARLLMGGTDLLVRMRDGKLCPQVVIDLKGLPGIREIDHDAQAGLTVGAAVTMNEVARHPAVLAHFPLLAQAAGSVASYQLRNRATLGGNLANASPAADTAPAVLVLEGRLLLHGPGGEREVPAGAFFVGPGRTCLQPGEFVVAVRFPPLPRGAAGTYLKLGRNRAGDLAIAGVAVLGFRDPAAPAGCRFRIALASVAPVPLRATAAEEALQGAAPPAAGQAEAGGHGPPPSPVPGAQEPPRAPAGWEARFARAAAEAMRACSPIDDVRATAAYRRAMVRNLTLRALREVGSLLQVEG